MLVHRSWLDNDETCFVVATLRDQIGQHVYPVHCLDRPTSGAPAVCTDMEADVDAVAEKPSKKRIGRLSWVICLQMA